MFIIIYMSFCYPLYIITSILCVHRWESVELVTVSDDTLCGESHNLPNVSPTTTAMVRLRLIKVFLIIVVIVVIVNLIVIAVNFSINKYKDSAVQQMRQITEEYLKEHPYADSSKPVPNIVHYVLFSIHEIQFGHFLSILSVLKNQRPKVIYVHCDCHRLSGQYWDRALKVADSVDTILVVRKIKKPTEIFDNKLSNSYMNWHASDLTRISVLKKFGGIYLDRDVYVIQPMHDLFKYELSLDFQGDVLGSQVIVSRPNARFLHLWLQSYRFYLFWEWWVEKTSFN